MFEHNPLPIPSPLKYIESQLKLSILPFLSILPEKKYTQPHGSKLAGQPYLPYNEKLPVNKKGEVMQLLAQLNFAEIGDIPPFPKEGLLQIFVDPDLFKTSMNTQRISSTHYTTRYYNKVSYNVIELYSIQNTQSNFIIQEEKSLQLIPKVEPISLTDYRFKHFINDQQIAIFFENTSNIFEEIYSQYYLSAEHKIGGYPYFLYKDIRGNSPSLRKYDTLLLQIVSNDVDNIMIGDCGVLKIFINNQKLRENNYTDLLFYVEDYSN